PGPRRPAAPRRRARLETTPVGPNRSTVRRIADAGSPFPTGRIIAARVGPRGLERPRTDHRRGWDLLASYPLLRRGRGRIPRRTVDADPAPRIARIDAVRRSPRGRLR